jgi:hypothetical protein
MDPLSFTASLVAILSIAGAAGELSMSMYRIRKAGSASLDIGIFAMDIKAFASVIRMAHERLTKHCDMQTQLQPSLVLQDIEKVKVLNQLVAQSESVMAQIELVQPRLGSMQSSFDFITRLKWLLRKNDVQALSLRMESVKTNLELVINIIQLEVLKQQEPSAETEQRM